MFNDKSAEPRGLIRVLVRWFVSLYYPRIEVANADRIPQVGPILLCANHGNSLIDPVIIGIAADRPVRFMAKAPLFEHPILGPPMSALGMIPAFRAMDDAQQVRRNLESLDVGARVLAEGRAMGIFPEGKSTDQAHLEMIRSGAARLALQALERGAQGLLVIPLGLTYERKEQFRSSVLVRVGEPIDVEGLVRAHQGDAKKARRDLTSMLISNLKQVVVHLDEPKWEPWLEDLEVLAEPSQGDVVDTGQTLWQRKRIADAMNYFLKQDRQRAEAIANEIEAYRKAVHATGLTVDSPVLRLSGMKCFLYLLWSFFVLALLFLPALFGTLSHIVPFVLVRRIAARMDQPGRKTISTNRMLVGVPLYLNWYAIVTVLLMLFDSRIALTWLALAPFAGLLAVHYCRRAGRSARLLYQQIKALIGRQYLRQLREQRTKLHEQLTELAGEYVRTFGRFTET